MSDEGDKPKQRPTIALSDTLRRQGAQKLSALVRAGDDEALERFRKQHLRGVDVELQELVDARTVLEQLVLLFDDGDRERWSQVEDAVMVLADETLTDADSIGGADDDAARDSEGPTTANVPRPPDLFEHLPPERALSKPEPPSPWTSWTGAARAGAATPSPPGSLGSPSSPAPTRAASSAVPSAPPLPSTPSPAMPGPPMVAAQPSPSTNLPAAGSTRTSTAPGVDGGPLRPSATPTEVDPMADVTAPPVTRWDPALPFQRPDEGQTQHLVHYSMAHGLALTLREYAALCAESDEAPQRRHLVHERYHVADTLTRELVRQAYEVRFNDEPSLRDRWQRHYDEFRAALRGSR